MDRTAQQRILEYARDRLGITELAARLEVSEQAVERWIRQEQPMPPAAMAALIALVDDLHQA